MDKRTYIIYVNYHGVVRKTEEHHDEFRTKSGGTGHRDYMDLHIDDDDGERVYLEDKCAARWPLYKRGVTGTFRLKISCEKEFGIKARIEVLEFTPDPEEG